MRFKDHADAGRKLPTEKQIGELMTSNVTIPYSCPTGSVADLYKKNSYGKLKIETDILPWVTISRTEAECADGENGYSDILVHCMHEALTILSNKV